MIRVLDAGCGFGQWSMALGKINIEIHAADVAHERISIALLVARELGLSNIKFNNSSIDRLPFPDDFFDGVFSYSVLYLIDFRAALVEFYRVLKPGGRLYFSTNGLGWYIFNLLERPNITEDYCPRRMAIGAIKNSLEFYESGARKPNQSIIMPSDFVLKYLTKIGFRKIIRAGEGKINIESREVKPLSFFKDEYYGEEGVYEVLCQK
jgi:SAM-dependent methyltransferase